MIEFITMKNFKSILFVLITLLGISLTNDSYSQCDVFIEPGSVVVTDNGSGVKFEFDITNNSSTDWYGDDLKMYWSLNSGAPIWNIDYTQNTYQPPIAPGETRTIKTPWFDIPNLPSWFPDDPNATQPWEESVEWAYYGLSFPFEGSWSQINLRLGSCGLVDGAWVYDSNGDPYYGPFNSDCDDVNSDAMCDCDLEITSFDPVSLDIEVSVVSHWNCGQPLNGLGNSNSSNTDAVDMIYFGAHVYGWDFPWGCTTGINHPGWTFTGWSALNNPNVFLYSGDVFQGNLNDLSPPNSCFGEILTDNTITECKEVVLWQINYSQTLNVLDGGWSIFLSGDDTQEYPDFNIENNSVLICSIPDVNGCTDPVASNYNPNATADDGSCEYLYPDANPNINLNSTTCLDGVPVNVYNITIFNPGDDTLFYYCVEIPELNYDECFDGYEVGQYWIEPNGGQGITQVTIPEGVEQITINVYEAEGEIEGTFSDNVEVVPVVFNGPNPCPLPGCTDPEADNYDPEANEEDGSCTYEELILDYIGAECVVYCDENGPYYYVTTTFENTGNVTITDFCAEWHVIGGEDNVQCFNGSLEPGETVELSHGPFYQSGSVIVWVYIQELNGILLDPEIGFYENLICDLNDVDICVYGCTDVLANNYNPNADLDDGSCEYPINDVGIDSLTYELDGCEGEPLYWTPEINITNYGETTITDICLIFNILDDNLQEDTICYQNLNILPNDSYVISLYPLYDGIEPINIYTELILEGDDVLMNNYLNLTFQMWCYDCTDSNADNYNPYATDDQSPNNCEYLGCTDPLANNYNILANVDDGSCEYDILGCTDPLALNYNPNANVDDGSCEYQEEEEELEEGDCNDNVFAPNTFTPNNDGLNDVWKVHTGEDCWIRWDVKIFNRWGDIVYMMDSPSEFWNGSKMDGSHYVSDGVYLYTITGVSKNRSYIETSGHISLFR